MRSLPVTRLSAGAASTHQARQSDVRAARAPKRHVHACGAFLPHHAHVWAASGVWRARSAARQRRGAPTLILMCLTTQVRAVTADSLPRLKGRALPRPLWTPRACASKVRRAPGPPAARFPRRRARAPCWRHCRRLCWQGVAYGRAMSRDDGRRRAPRRRCEAAQPLPSHNPRGGARGVLRPLPCTSSGPSPVPTGVVNDTLPERGCRVAACGALALWLPARDVGLLGGGEARRRARHRGAQGLR